MPITGGTGGGITPTGSNPRGAGYWLLYPFANDFGGQEPYGNFPKPDINIQVPAGSNIDNITPGTVTKVDYLSPYGYVVTIKLDTPYNNLATHAAYLHLASINVSEGQHVGWQDSIGTAGPPGALGYQNAPLGFAFYPGDWYGHGPEWNQYFQNASTAQLNPFQFLTDSANAFSSGSNPGAPGQKPNIYGDCAAAYAAANKGLSAVDPARVANGWNYVLCTAQAAASSSLPRIGKGILGGLLLLAGVIGGIVVLLHPEVATPAGAIRAVGKAI